MNFLILSNSPQKKLVEAIKKQGHTCDTFNPTDMYIYASDNVKGFDQLFYASKDSEEPTRIIASKYDAVISRIGNALEYGSIVLTHLVENMGLYAPQTGQGLRTASNKLLTTQRLSSSGIKIPKTITAYTPQHPKFLIEKVGGLPAVAKRLKGSQGRGVIKLNDEEQTAMMFEGFWNENNPMKLQECINNLNKDYRVIVIGDKVAVAMERDGGDKFRANISLGAKGKKVQLSKEDEELCIKASKAIGLEFSGVDLLKDENDNSYVVEINGNMGTKIIDITGVNFFEDLVKHIEQKVSKKNHSEKPDDKKTYQSIEEIETSLGSHKGLDIYQVEASIKFLKQMGFCFVGETIKDQVSGFVSSVNFQAVKIHYPNLSAGLLLVSKTP